MCEGVYLCVCMWGCGCGCMGVWMCVCVCVSAHCVDGTERISIILLYLRIKQGGGGEGWLSADVVLEKPAKSYSPFYE